MDILIILLGIYPRLQSEHIFRDLVFEIPQAKDSLRVGLAGLTERLGQVKCQGLPFLHCFTGDTTNIAYRDGHFDNTFRDISQITIRAYF